MDRFLDVCLVLVVGVVPLVFYPRAFDSLLAKTWALGILVSLMGAAILVAAFWGRRISWPRSPVNAAVWALIAVGIAALALSSYRYAGVGAMARLASGGLLYFVIIHHVQDAARAKRLVWAMAAGALAACAYGILQRFGIDFVAWSKAITRIPGPYGNPTFFASYLALLLPVTILMFVFPPVKASRRSLARAFFAVAAAAMLACLAWTRTAAAIGGVGIAMGMGAAALAYFNAADRRRGLLKLGVTVVLLAVAGWGALFHVAPARYRNRILSLAHPTDLADTRRVLIWKAALQIFMERPELGGGPGTFQIYSRGRYAPLVGGGRVEEASGALHAHNAFFEALADMGAPGGAALIWLLVAYFWTAVKAVKRSLDAFWANLSVGMAAGVVAFLIQNLFAVTFFIPGCQMFFWVALGLTVAGVQESEGPRPVRSVSLRLRGAARWAAAGAVAVVALIVWTAPVRVVLAEYHYWLGEILAQRGVPARAVTEFERAVAADSYCQRGWYQLGAYMGKEGRWRDAAQDLERSAAMSPDYLRTQYNLGVCYRRLEEYPKSARAFRRALRAENSALNYVALAETYVRWGRPELAKRQIESGLEQHPYDLLVRQGAASVYLATGDLERAEVNAMQALELSPDDPRNEWLLAQVYLAEGKYPLARRALERVLQLAPGSVLARRAQALLPRQGAAE